MKAIGMKSQFGSIDCHDRQRQTSSVGTSSDGRLFVCTCTADVADVSYLEVYSILSERYYRTSFPTPLPGELYQAIQLTT